LILLVGLSQKLERNIMTLFNEIEQVIKHQFKLKDQVLTPETNLFNDLKFDSLDAVELIIELEEKFSIELLDKEAEDIKTIQDILTLIESKR
jgi:acyl carrier protein